MEEDFRTPEHKQVIAMEEDSVPENTSTAGDSTSQNQSLFAVPIPVAWPWVAPKSVEEGSSQNMAVDNLDSENLENGLSSNMELGECLVNSQESLVIADVTAENTDMTAQNTEESPPTIDMTEHFVTDEVFNSRTELVNWCQEVGKRLMTVVVMTKSQYSTKEGRKPQLYLGCERGGVFRDHRKKCDVEGRQIRRTGTKRCGCPFALRGLKQNEGDQWKLEVRCGVHNHPTDRASVGHSYAGRLSREEKQLVLEMSKSGVSAKDVLRTIKERNKRSASTLTTIYNTRAKLRVPEIECGTAVQELMKLALKNQYIVWHRKDGETNEVKDLFLAHPESLQLLKRFPSVLMVDCTCKDNKFKMLLFEIVGAASTGQPITIAFIVVEAEREENYLWAMSRLKTIFDPKFLPGVFVTNGELALMNAISVVFPYATHLVCTQHIWRSIITHCKNHFETDEELNQFLHDWGHLSKSETQIEFVERLATFEMLWANFPHSLAYLKENWLAERKEQFVSSWTNSVKHYGNTSISRAETAHSRLTMFLTSSQGTIGTIWISIQNMIIGEITDIKASFKKSLSKVPPSQELDPLSELRGSISYMALDLVAAEVSRSLGMLAEAETCTCALRQTHGLPCVHEVVQFTNEGRLIPLSLIDSHWKKLSLIPFPEMHSPLSYEPLYQQLTKKWEESNEEERMFLLEKMSELVDSDPSWSIVPIEAKVQKCRPRKLARNSCPASQEIE